LPTSDEIRELRECALNGRNLAAQPAQRHLCAHARELP
jgi:hypothetical protein